MIANIRYKIRKQMFALNREIRMQVINQAGWDVYREAGADVWEDIIRDYAIELLNVLCEDDSVWWDETERQLRGR